MEKTININEKDIKFKSSAATNILYKKAFGEDILVKITAYTKNLKEVKEIQKKASELKDDTNKTSEEKLALIEELMSSEAYIASNKFMNDCLPRLAYIMWLEGNEIQTDILKKLNDDSFLIWLMTIDQDELLAVTGDIMEIWQAGAKNHSKPKN